MFTINNKHKTQAMDYEQPALDVHRLAAGYDGDPHAIYDVSFTVNAAERVAIVGPNGAGKSTLFKAIVGLIPFTMGHISIYGVDCRSSHSYVGYVPQHEAVDWSFPVSVYDVVMMGRARHIGWFRGAGKTDHERVHQLLDELGLSELAHRQIGQLSGGQKRRVFIARALAQDTRVLLMDEPFTGVDKVAEQEIMETLDVLTDNGITILLSTHDMGKASQEFDKVILLKKRLLAYGAPQTVFTPDNLSQAYGGSLRVFNDGQETVMIMDEHGCGD
ncbi:MAG: metal ABC transporter ATP-binding protein [Anaerolineae bacterium]